MLQFDFVMEDFNINKPMDFEINSPKDGMISYDEIRNFDRIGKELVEKHFGEYRRDKDGSIAFCMHRQIHKATSNHGDNCCTCNRSDMLAGEPAIIISK